MSYYLAYEDVKRYKVCIMLGRRTVAEVYQQSGWTREQTNEAASKMLLCLPKVETEMLPTPVFID